MVRASAAKMGTFHIFPWRLPPSLSAVPRLGPTYLQGSERDRYPCAPSAERCFSHAYKDILSYQEQSVSMLQVSSLMRRVWEERLWRGLRTSWQELINVS